MHYVHQYDAWSGRVYESIQTEPFKNIKQHLLGALTLAVHQPIDKRCFNGLSIRHVSLIPTSMMPGGSTPPAVVVRHLIYCTRAPGSILSVKL